METKTFKIKKDLYSKTVLFRSCSQFIDNYYIYLDSSDSDWIINVKSKNIKNETGIEGEFKNILISEAFRENLSLSTKNIKEMIVARALYSADIPGIMSNPDENNPESNDKKDYSFLEKELGNYKEDPAGIAIPWEEKNKNQ